MRLPNVERRRLAVALTLTVVLTSACAATPTDELRISIRRVALSLAFEDDDKAQPVAPERIIEIIPAPAELVASRDLEPFRTPTDRPLDDDETVDQRGRPVCRPAPEGTALQEVVSVSIDAPPKPGWYRRHNQGKLTITGGPIPLTLPFPRVTIMEVRDVKEVERPDVNQKAGDAARQAPPVADAVSAMRTTTVTQFTVAHEIATITLTDTYEYDGDGLRLVQRTTKTAAATAVFTPTPQITLVTLGDFGGDWSEGGSDRESRTAMVVQGEIAAQEAVDVCGTLVDTLRFENDEQTVNLSTQETSGTGDVPNTYNIAPQHGGLIVQEEKHFTQVATVDDAKLVIDWDYVSTLGNLDPYPSRAALVEALAR
jgi:hypothetical protein